MSSLQKKILNAVRKKPKYLGSLQRLRWIRKTNREFLLKLKLQQTKDDLALQLNSLRDKVNKLGSQRKLETRQAASNENESSLGKATVAFNDSAKDHSSWPERQSHRWINEQLTWKWVVAPRGSQLMAARQFREGHGVESQYQTTRRLKQKLGCSELLESSVRCSEDRRQKRVQVELFSRNSEKKSEKEIMKPVYECCLVVFWG